MNIGINILLLALNNRAHFYISCSEMLASSNNHTKKLRTNSTNERAFSAGAEIVSKKFSVAERLYMKSRSNLEKTDGDSSL